MRNFLKQTFASAIGTLLGLLLFFGLSISGMLVILVALAAQDNEPQVKDRSVLVYDLSLNITDAPRNSSTSALIQNALSGESNRTIALRTVLDTLEKARRDPKIIGIYLDGSNGAEDGSSGYAKFKEVRGALEKFRAAGKKIIAYSSSWGEKEYYLSSVADTVVLNPLGAMEINGLGASTPFLTGALEKFGVGIQVIRVGKFKAAVEPLIRKNLSPENRQQTEKLLNDLWGEWRAAVGQSRKISPNQLQAIADGQGFLLAETAQKQGLVDKVDYFDRVLAQLKQLTGEEKENKTFRQISLSAYAGVSGKALGVERNSENKVAIVYAEGDIVDGQGEAGQVGGDRFARIFRQLRQNPNVKAVVLRVNSPGGSATASEIIQREIRLTREAKKPVVVSMGDVAASGGYWIVTDANRIFAEPNTITGSIGVFGLLPNFQKLANNNGVTWDVVKTGKYADSQTVSRPKSPAELAVYQRAVDRIYSTFLSKVVEGRDLPQQKVEEIAQGRVWSGVSAKQIGLVDEIGGLDAAIDYATKQAKLGDDWEVAEYPETRSLEERLFGQVSDGVRTALGHNTAANQLALPAPIAVEVAKMRDELAILQAMNDPLGVYARLPFNLKIE